MKGGCAYWATPPSKFKVYLVGKMLIPYLGYLFISSWFLAYFQSKIGKNTNNWLKKAIRIMCWERRTFLRVVFIFNQPSLLKSTFHFISKPKLEVVKPWWFMEDSSSSSSLTSLERWIPVHFILLWAQTYQ